MIKYILQIKDLPSPDNDKIIFHKPLDIPDAIHELRQQQYISLVSMDTNRNPDLQTRESMLLNGSANSAAVG